MSRLVSAQWTPERDITGVPRRHRQPCRYDAFVPDRLVGREVLLPADVAADVSDAERAVQRLNASGIPYRGYEAIARLLLRAEAVASSRIEGLEIGGRRLARADAAREVGALLKDLVGYLDSDVHPPVVQAAIAHAQFETIHPFADGNGRTGRALIHVVLTRRGLSPHHVPPVSLVLATRSRDYVAGLESFRADGHAGVAEWIATFAAATSEACARVAGLTDGLVALDRRWREALGPVRAGSTVAQLLDEILPRTPITTVAQLVRLTGRSAQAVNEAVDRLHRAGVLRQTTAGRRNRAFEVNGLVDLITGFERSLASPVADTAVEPPVRPVPHRAPGR
ncbi:Fic family protein [Kineococcus sp. LSe6-4]|uniref:Fic family protein n=1 Tax=Kineococcus halophytocola TaxID=3234027 RepID=A0ABV4H5G1_9ACTN